MCWKCRFIGWCLLMVLLFSCRKEPDYLENALRFAGENRPELEKVLAHYSSDLNDSLKLKAAKFLIKNMPGHYSFKDTTLINNYYNQIDSILDVYKDDPYNKEMVYIEKITNTGRLEISVVQDIHCITSEFLINNIDRSFHAWQQGEWASHINFDDFCEYILPYKEQEGQPLNNWRTDYADFCERLKYFKYCSQLANSSYHACEAVNSELIDRMNPKIITPDYSYLPIRKLSTLMKIPIGTCNDYSFIATSVMRAKGIPVVTDFTPQWPFRSLSHSWNVLLENTGLHIAFMGAETPLGVLHKKDHKMAKAYRKTYAINREIEQLNRSEKYVPKVLQNLFFKDVSDEYMVTKDIECRIKNKKSNYAYLAVFNNKDWIPIQWGKVSGNRVVFKKMGKNIMYMPVIYERNTAIAFAEPFILTLKGEIQPILPDTSKKQTLTLLRKYPVLYDYDVGMRMIGGQFQASDHPEFNNFVITHTIQEYGVNAKEVKLDLLPHRYRYWRYFSSDYLYSYCNMAEIYFFEKDSIKPSYGKIIGSSGSYRQESGYTKEAVFDGDILTFFDAPEANGCWVGMDFGKAVEINRIIYTPRSDGNCIERGDEYELLFWFNHQWNSLGKKKAENVTLQFENCPMNALFLLRDLTKGKQERIFTYENEEQVWW